MLDASKVFGETAKRKCQRLMKDMIDWLIDRQRSRQTYEELAHPIMETEKFHCLLSTTWRPRRPSGVMKWDSEGLSSRGADRWLVWLPVWEQEKTDVPAQKSGRGRERKREWNHSSFPFCSVWTGPQRMRWGPPHWEGQPTEPMIQMLVSSGNTPMDTSRSNVSSGCPVANQVDIQNWPSHLSTVINTLLKITYFTHQLLGFMSKIFYFKSTFLLLWLSLFSYPRDYCWTCSRAPSLEEKEFLRLTESII